MIALRPGDRCYLLVNGRRLRGVVGDFLALPIRGQKGRQALVPFQRGMTIRWVTRGELRKLPDL